MTAHTPADAYVIRRAQMSDLEALLALEQHAFTTDHLSRRQYRHHLRNRTAVVLVAVDDDGLLGKAVLFFRAGIDIARLYSIAVATRARGRGIAKGLLAAIEVAARQHPCRRLRLEVRQDNAAAIALYERAGYVRLGARAEYYEDGADAWRYEKMLVPPRFTPTHPRGRLIMAEQR